MPDKPTIKVKAIVIETVSGTRYEYACAHEKDEIRVSCTETGIHGIGIHAKLAVGDTMRFIPIYDILKMEIARA